MNALVAFHQRDYRFLWGSALGVSIAFWMEIVVIGWLMLQISGSPALVGLAAALRYAGTALGPFSGALADRFDRRRLIIIARAVACGYALVMGALYFTSSLQVWHIFILVLVGSLAMGFSNTAASALIADTVETQDLASAAGMITVGASSVSVVGPMMAGYLYDLDVTWCFAFIALAYLTSCLLVAQMKSPPRTTGKVRQSVLSSMVDGVRYVSRNRAMAALMVYAAIANLFIFPCVMDTMSLFAKNVLKVGASGLGLLIAAGGLGRLTGALVSSTLGQFKSKGWLLVILMVVWPAAMAVFAVSRLFPVTAVLLALVGIGQGLSMALIQLLLLTWSSEAFRGRVMGVRSSVVIMEMTGSILVGALAGGWGIATIYVVAAVGGILTSTLTALWSPSLRVREQPYPTIT